LVYLWNEIKNDIVCFLKSLNIGQSSVGVSEKFYDKEKKSGPQNNGILDIKKESLLINVLTILE
jgi:hypothetical protein